MATSAAVFNAALAGVVAEMQNTVQALETWAGNKEDSSPTYDFSGDLNTINVLQTAFETGVVGILAH